MACPWRLFVADGLAMSRYVGLTFEGRGKAAVGFNHFSTLRFETEVVHRHLAFRNFTGAGFKAEKDDAYALARPPSRTASSRTAATAPSRPASTTTTGPTT